MPRFNLMLVNKQIHNEAIPIISLEMVLEVKTYRMGDPRADIAIRNLSLASGFCKIARRVIIDLTPGHWASSLTPIASHLKEYTKLKEVTIRALIHQKQPHDMRVVEPILGIAKAHKSILCFQLIDARPTIYWRPTVEREHRLIRKEVFKMARAKLEGESVVSSSFPTPGLNNSQILTL